MGLVDPGHPLDQGHGEPRGAPQEGSLEHRLPRPRPPQLGLKAFERFPWVDPHRPWFRQGRPARARAGLDAPLTARQERGGTASATVATTHRPDRGCEEGCARPPDQSGAPIVTPERGASVASRLAEGFLVRLQVVQDGRRRYRPARWRNVAIRSKSAAVARSRASGLGVFRVDTRWRRTHISLPPTGRPGVTSPVATVAELAASVAKLVDATALEAVVRQGLGGSSPLARTTAPCRFWSPRRESWGARVPPPAPVAPETAPPGTEGAEGHRRRGRTLHRHAVDGIGRHS